MQTITILPLLIAFGALSVGMLCLLVGWYLWYESQDLRSGGLTVTATILKKFRKDDQGIGRSLESYYAQCQFYDPTGQAREVDVYMQLKRWLQMDEGTTTLLTYIPDERDEPLLGSRFNWQLRGMIGLGLMALGMCLILVLTVGGIQEWLTMNRAF
ncbi:hypothetical protein [Spirosoma agri]|uniref:DUF3592 domain-containing protein n=1 Tax=Spirosoma agri TaxID=1987381 RepID=A0A6M0ID67_9BACT|nr:hypothetical protein [Spirosoma agri]NEU66154.1 hypothetical protein [Spirosoma agri]